MSDTPTTDLLDVIARAWSWQLPAPKQILRTNKFGNVLVHADDGYVWRICPEEVSCIQLNLAVVGVDALLADRGFRDDWEMAEFVALAERLHGEQPDGRCFCLEVPTVLGGQYVEDNIATTSVVETLRTAGELGLQIRDLPDGAEVRWGEHD